MKLNEICKNCKWWKSEYMGDSPGGELHRICLHPKVGGDSYNDTTRRGIDGLNSYESISTGPDFGCVHWEELI